MVRSTYKALTNIKKGVVDAKKPKTFDLIKKLSSNRRPSKFADIEHARNLMSLGRRINNIEKVPVT